MNYNLNEILLGKSNNGNSGNYSNASKNKSTARFAIGSGSGGKSKASSSNSRNVEAQKPKMNAIGYIYPQVMLSLSIFIRAYATRLFLFQIILHLRESSVFTKKKSHFWTNL